MAQTKAKKYEVVDEVVELLKSSKLTVIAQYQGTTVKALQTLRNESKANGTKVRVVKNRLVIKAMQQADMKDVDTSELKGMLLYAFNDLDEVAPAQSLSTFSRKNPTIKFVGGISADGKFLSAADIVSLASLPSKDQLRGILVGTIAAPLSGFVNVLASNVRGVLNVLNARAEALGN